MLLLKLTVPVDLGIVKLEDAAVLTELHIQVIGACENLVTERTEFGLGAHIVRLVDDGVDVNVLLNDDLPNHLLVGKVLISEIEMRYMACRVETTRNVVVKLFGE